MVAVQLEILFQILITFDIELDPGIVLLSFLIHQILVDDRLLNELAVIGAEKVYDKSIVLIKVQVINQELEQLNTIRKEVLLADRQRENNLYKQFDDQHHAFETLHSEVRKYLDELNKYDALTDPPEESPTLDLSEEKQKAWMDAITIDHGEVGTVL